MKGGLLMEPYPFQALAVRRAVQRVGRGRRVLITSPPGSGKTVMIAEMARTRANRADRVLILAQRREILRQTYLHLTGVGVSEHRIGVIQPNPVATEDMSRPIQVASMATLMRRRLNPPADLVILDEAHHAVADGHFRVLDHYRRAGLVGLTATPIRMDGRGLGDVFDDLVVAALPSELIHEKRMAKPRPFSAPEEFLPNLERVRRAMGDYVRRDLERRVDRPALIGDVVRHYLERAEGKTAIVFASTLNHSQHLVERFQAAGIPAEHLDGRTSTNTRDEIIGRLRTGETLVVSNVGILHEGFDLPRTYAVILARPTLSLALYLQQTGRGLRRYGNQRPLILDHAGNYNLFGYPEADRQWTLSETVIQPTGASPTRACPQCNAIIPRSARTCPACGAELSEARPAIEEDRHRRLQELTEREREIYKQRIDTFLAEEGHNLEEWSEWREQLLEIWTAERSL
jgi:superfamily II DNA or RNA helicase